MLEVTIVLALISIVVSVLTLATMPPKPRRDASYRR